jgi:hypothetical protein
LLEGQLDGEPDQQGYELLALWSALRRVQPVLLRRASGRPIVDRLTKGVGKNGLEWAALAAGVPSPRRWLAEARRAGETMGDTLVSSEVLVPMARDLLWALDEAELFAAALHELGRPLSRLDAALQSCRNWTIVHPDVFLPAGVFLQAVAAAFDPRLEDDEGPLAATTAKYVFLLDALEAVESELRMDDVVSPIDSQAWRELARRGRHADTNVIAKISWLPQSLLAAAQVTALAPARYYWREPAGTRTARLIVPVHASRGDSEQLTLSFQDAKGRPCQDLVGAQAVLSGVPATIRRNASALYRVSRLRNSAGETPELVVAGRKWRRQSQPRI